MNLDYTKVTHEELLEQFKNRMLSDPRFKDIGAASLYQLYMEMMAGTFDMVHFYLGRTAEEMYLDSARLDSSVIKLSKNLGYNPKRAIPARAEIAVKISGPLPANIEAGYKIWFNNEQLKLSFNNNPYRLDRCYSYEFTEDDILGGRNNAQWSKTIHFAVDNEDVNGYTTLSTTELNRIKVLQCDVKTKEIYAVSHLSNLGKSYQFYDIDDTDFSNYYGSRDQYAIDRFGNYTPESSWCKIGIGLNKTDAFSKEKLCDIEIENIYCNSRVKALNDKLTNPVKLNVCRVESLQDKTVRITFGDGSLVNNGFNTQDEILYVQYVTTAGYAANTPNVIDNALNCGSKIVATGPGRDIDVTKNIAFILTSDIAGGENFESQISMKNNAAVYFAARGQLINKKDFTAYFNSISDPITTKTAIAWHMNEVYTKLGIDSSNYDVRTATTSTNSIVFYTVLGDLYTSLTDKKFAPQMLYTADDDVIASTTLYANRGQFDAHLFDLTYSVKSIDNAKQLFLSQKNNKENPFYLNTNRIISAIDDRLPFGVMPVSLPPIVQYFDLVGTVDVSRTTNISDYKDDIENTIYKWLRDNQRFNNKIYKSDIVKLFYDNTFTKAVNVDLTPSSMIYSPDIVYSYPVTNTANTEANKAYVLQTASDNANYYNVVVIPATASNGRQLTVEYLNSLTSIGFAFGANAAAKASIINVEELSDGRLKIVLNGYGFNGTYSANTTLALHIQPNDVVYSDNAIANVNFTDSSIKDKTETYETPVPLPYTVSAINNVKIHELTYKRKANDVHNANSLTELGFNIIYARSKDNAADYNAAYKAAKFAICDSILDDNNNIVNFSLPHEIAVVRLMVEYRNSRA